MTIPLIYVWTRRETIYFIIIIFFFTSFFDLKLLYVAGIITAHTPHVCVCSKSIYCIPYRLGYVYLYYEVCVANATFSAFKV